MASLISSFHHNFTKPHLPLSTNSTKLSTFSITLPTNFPLFPQPLKNSLRTRLNCSKSSEEAQVSDKWLHRLPDKKKPLYSHSLPCIESWLKSLHFYQAKDDRALWFIQHPHWHAQLSLDLTDLYIRYLKSGPGILEKDVERRFSYALSREDIENAILGGP